MQPSATPRPEWNANVDDQDFIPDEANQAQQLQYSAQYYAQPNLMEPIIAPNAAAQDDPLIVPPRRYASLNRITEVDLSNEAILAMVVNNWGLNPSSIMHLPLEHDNERISDEDLLELISHLL